MDNREYWVWLIMVFGAANGRLWQLSARHKNVIDFVAALKSNCVSDLTDGEISRIIKYEIADAQKIILQCEESGIKVYCYESEGYPAQIRKISNPPAVLFCRGNLDFLNNNINVAVVGTRNPSEYSLKATSTLCSDFCKRGCGVITGIAQGIDQLANLTAIELNGSTCGVCGRAVDGDYPPNSEDFKSKLVENGALISETCSFLKVADVSFTNRNRILVGLADAVVFVECRADSRGLDNANHAIAQGKQIFVVPPADISDKRYFGQRDLIRQGCKVIFNGEDLIYYASSARFEDVRFDKIGGTYGGVDDSDMFFKPPASVKKKHSRTGAKKNEQTKKMEKTIYLTKVDYTKLNEVQSAICRLLEKKPMLADVIAMSLELDITSVISELTALELDEVVVSLPGKIFAIK